MALSIREPAFKIRTDGTDTWDTLQPLLDLAGGQEAVDFDDGRVRVSKPLRMSVGGRYRGTYRLGRTGGSVVEGIGLTNVWEMPALAPDGGSAAVAFEGFHLLGGVDQLYAPNGAVWVTLRDITFDSPSHAGIYGRSFLQNWSADTIDFNGGRYGFYYPYETGRDGGSSILFDKCRFVNCHATGQTINGWYVTPKLSNNIHWESLHLIASRQDGFVFGGGIRMWTFDNVNTEANGFLGYPKPAGTVPKYSDFKALAGPWSGGSGPAGISWRGASVGMVGGTNELLYGMDLAELAGPCSAYECQNGRPINDPNHMLKVYGRPLTMVA